MSLCYTPDIRVKRKLRALVKGGTQTVQYIAQSRDD